MILNRENIESILKHYGLQKIQTLLYAGELENDERKDLGENIRNDNALLIPVCQNCYSKKKEICGVKQIQ